MNKINYKITRKDGIHARPAGEFVNFAKNFDNNTKITINFNNKSANAKKLFDVMSLCLKCNDEAKFLIEYNGNNSTEIEEDVKKKILEFLTNPKDPW